MSPEQQQIQQSVRALEHDKRDLLFINQELTVQIQRLKTDLASCRNSVRTKGKKITELEVNLTDCLDQVRKTSQEREAACVVQERHLARRQAAHDREVRVFTERSKSQRTYERDINILEDQLQERDTKITSLRAALRESQCLLADWADSCHGMEHGSELYKAELPWMLSEMRSWGQNNVPYPPQIVQMGMTLSMEETQSSRVKNAITAVLKAFLPDLEVDTIKLPSSSTINRWRCGLLVLSDLVAAIKIANTNTLTIHADGTTKSQRKYGVGILNTDEGPVMAGGIY
jgi:hypothetical protein